MRSILFALTLSASIIASAGPRQCNPEKSIPCGKSCIAKDLKCHKTAEETTAVVRTTPKK